MNNIELLVKRKIWDDSLRDLRSNDKCAQHSVHPALRQAQGPLVGVCAFSGSFLRSSWFRQSGVISFRLVVEPVETHQWVPRRERARQATSRWAIQMLL